MKLKVEPMAVALVWLVIFMFALDSEDVGADPYLEYGQLQNETDATFAGIGYTYKDKWDASVLFVGEGDRRDGGGKTPKMKVMSVSRLVYPTWTDKKFYMGIGLSKSELESQGALVGVYNFKIQFGWDFGRSKIFYQHHSSGDVNDVNVGVDMIGVQVKL